MNCQTEDQLDRVTWIGWLLIVVHAAIFAVVGPILAINFVPPALLTPRTLLITILASGGGSFLFCKWLLEKRGVVVIRPAKPKPAKQEI